MQFGHGTQSDDVTNRPEALSSSAIVCSVAGLQVHCTLPLYTTTATLQPPSRQLAPISLSLLLLPSPHTALDSNDRRSSISGFTKVPRKGEGGGVGEAFALAIDRNRSIVQRGVERSKRRIFRVRRRRERSLNVRGNGRGYVRERHFES